MNDLETYVDHVSVIVADIDVSTAFYRDILGLQRDDSRPDLGYPGAWFKTGGAAIHLLQVENPDPTRGRPEHGGRDRHVAFRIANLDKLVSRLEADRIPYTRSRSGRAAIFFRDPDGNGLEFIELE